MDVVRGAHRVIVLMEHTAKNGSSKIVKGCAPPLTGERYVHRVITDLVDLDIPPEGLAPMECGPGCDRRGQRRPHRLTSDPEAMSKLHSEHFVGTS
ncbi:hypothetical protein [Streptomyces sp. NPDC004270]